MRVIGVDPGNTGAIAIIDPDRIYLYTITPALDDLIAQIQALYDDEVPSVTYVEDVGNGMPGNSSRSTTVFARHNGHLDILLRLYAPEGSVHYVRPTKWMDGTVGSKRPKGQGARAARKRMIHEYMKDTWRNVSDVLTLSQADALAIATYGLSQQSGE